MEIWSPAAMKRGRGPTHPAPQWWPVQKKGLFGLGVFGARAWGIFCFPGPPFCSPPLSTFYFPPLSSPLGAGAGFFPWYSLAPSGPMWPLLGAPPPSDQNRSHLGVGPSPDFRFTNSKCPPPPPLKSRSNVFFARSFLPRIKSRAPPFSYFFPPPSGPPSPVAPPAHPPIFTWRSRKTSVNKVGE